VLRLVAAWIVVFGAFAGLVAQAPAAHADTGSEEALFLSLTNSLRAGKGLGSLAPDGSLTSIARSWSSHMAAAGAISHNPSLTSQVTAPWQELGENVGTGGDVQTIQTAFINSPHHYENLVNPDYNYVGIGVVHGGNGAIYVTVDFMYLPGHSVSTPAPTSPKVAAPRVTVPRATAPAAPRTAAPAAASSGGSGAAAPAAGVTAGPAAVPVAAPRPPRVDNGFAQVLSQLREADGL
jgi:cell division septation protein DedD